jgi:hypothetical protein
MCDAKRPRSGAAFQVHARASSAHRIARLDGGAAFEPSHVGRTNAVVSGTA